jgi:DNA-binding CsgD family transcriptional regulator
MPGLSTGDVQAFNEAVLALHATRAASELPWQLHLALRKLIGSGLTVVDWIDSRTASSLDCRLYPEHHVSRELSALANTLAPTQSPVWLRCADEPGAISDFLTREEWERRELCWVYRQGGLMDSLGIDIRLAPSLVLRLRDLRETYGQYTGEDHLKLQLLGPHIRQAYRRLAAQGGLEGPRRELQRHVEIDVHGQKCRWPEVAREMLAAQDVRARDGSLPEPVRSWLTAQQAVLTHDSEAARVEPLVLENARNVLRIYLVPEGAGGGDGPTCRLVLHERAVTPLAGSPAQPGLSRREREVLHWVAQGKTNAEIATILGVSPGTVKRHLENLYPKLGVENRHAAALLFLQGEAPTLVP